MLTAVACLAIGQALLDPPLHRAWTFVSGSGTRVHGVWNEEVHYSAGSIIGILNVKTGKPVWQQERKYLDECISNGKSFFTIEHSPVDDNVVLMSFAAETGKENTLYRGPIERGSAVADQDNVYLQLGATVVAAIDATTGKVKWQTNLNPAFKPNRMSLSCLSVGNGSLIAGVSDLGTYCLEPETGQVRWSSAIGQESAGTNTYVFVPDGVVSLSSGITFYEARSGKVRWKFPQGFDKFGVIGRVLFARGSGYLLGIDLENGKELWRLTGLDVGLSYGAGPIQPFPSSQTHIWLNKIGKPPGDGSMPGYDQWTISPLGEVIQKIPVPFTGMFRAASGEWLLTTDGERFLLYRKGSLAPIPTDPIERKTAVEAAVANIEFLDDEERARLVEHADLAFQPLLSRFVTWGKRKRGTKESEVVNGVESYGLYADVAKILEKMFRLEDSSAAVEAWRELPENSDVRSRIEIILARKGDPEAYMPLLVHQLRTAPSKVSRETVEIVSRSRRPEAVELMIEILADPKAIPSLRLIAFRRLAGTGGQAGATAVSAWKSKFAPRNPWYADIAVAKKARDELIGEKKDAKGRTWRLFKAGALGHFDDLFIAQQTATGWSRPLWIGVYDGGTYDGKPITKYRGHAMKELVADEWINLFPDDDAIRKDTDGDELTDIVEARLGTNPKKADTDGDGLKDAVDPCPNAAPRAMGDAEKVIGACIEARFFESDWWRPATITADGIKPFEMYGYARQVFWAPGGKSPLRAVYGGGVLLINFHAPYVDGKRLKDPVRFSEDGRTAWTLISRYSDGLEGDGYDVTLKKIGDDWYVVNMTMSFIS